jgi:hypothetical protein
MKASEERGQRPRVAAHGAVWAASFEEAGRSRPPQDEEVSARPVKTTVPSPSNSG